jgi:plastocyanin
MTHTPIRLAACVAVLVATGAACGSGDATDRGAIESPGDAGSITIELIAFKPAQVEVAVGGTVTWRQEDVATHTVTSGRVEQVGGTATAVADGKFDSGNITKGQQFRFTFPEPGQFAFYCAIHPATMTGVVTVK